MQHLLFYQLQIELLVTVSKWAMSISSSKVASILDEMKVDYSEDMMSELIKDLSIDSRVDLFNEDDERKEELLRFIEDVPPFLLIDYQLTRHVVHMQTNIDKPEQVEVAKPFRKAQPLSQYRSFINDPVHRIHYYKEFWSKNKIDDLGMGRVLKEDYKILYKKRK